MAAKLIYGCIDSTADNYNSLATVDDSSCVVSRHHNITGELTQELLPARAKIRLSSISLTNVHADTACYMDLYVERKMFGKFYLLKKIGLPIGATLCHNIKGFDSSFGLYIKLTRSASETPAVDVILS